MDRKQIIEMLVDLEMRFPTSSWMIDGIHVWPVLRIMISESIHAKVGNQGRTLRDGYINDYEMNNLSWLDEQVDAVFLTTNMYKIQVDQVWYDRFCDPIKDMFIANQHKLLFLETESDRQERKPRYTPVVPIQGYLDSCSKKYSVYTEVQSLFRYAEFFKYATDHYKINHQTLNLIYLSDRVQRIRRRTNFFKMVFSKVKPKIGFVVNYYSENGLSFVLACNEYGIPSVDIQHGVQGDYHIAYGNWGRLPAGGYRLLPTYFWCWSEEERKSIEKWSDGFHQPLVFGNLWIEQWKGDNPLTKEYDKLLTQNEVENEERRILVTLQPLYGLPGWGSNLPSWFFHAMKESPSNWKWWIRLHPQMFKGRFDFEAENIYNMIAQYNLLDKVEIEKATDLPLYALLRHCDIHITGHSTTVIEAEQFGVPSVIIHINGVYHYPEQIENGWVVTAFEKDDLIRSIETQIKRGRKKTRCAYSDCRQQSTRSIYSRLLNLMESSSKAIHDVEADSELFNEFLEMNGFLYEIIEHHNEHTKVATQLCVASSYYQLRKKELAASVYQYCLEKLSRKSFSSYILDVKKIVEMIEVYPQFDSRSQENVMAVLNTISKHEDHIGVLLKILFQKNYYDWIIRIGEMCREQSSCDVLFYVGRSYKFLRKFSESAFYLEKYIRNVGDADWKGGITCSNDYLLSAYFHLGECQYQLQKYDQSLKIFRKCIDLSNGLHEKAAEYINQIQLIRKSKE